jgi:hypothetical protein
LTPRGQALGARPDGPTVKTETRDADHLTLASESIAHDIARHPSMVWRRHEAQTDPSVPPSAVLRHRSRGARIGEMLVQKGLVTRAQVAEVLLRQYGSGKRIGQLLVDAGYVTRAQVATALGEQTLRKGS